MNELEGLLSTQITVPPSDLKSGTMNELSEREIKFFRLTNTGRHRLNNIELKYTRSYTKNSNRSLMHWRDLLVGWTISLLLRNCLTSDIKGSKLTTQAYNYYRNNDGSEVWRKDMWGVSKGKVYSNFGSLSYFFKDVSVNLDYPITACNTLTKYLLSLYSNGDNYRDIHQNYLLYLLEGMDLNDTEQRLTRIQKEEILAPDSLKFIRRNLLVEEDWKDLETRVLMGEYRKELVKLINLEEFEKRLFNRVRPLGTIGFYTLLIADNLIEICKRITTYSNELQNADLFDFFKSGDKSIKKEIYNNLTVASYASFYLQFFNTFSEAKSIFDQVRELLFLLELDDYDPNDNYKLF